MSLPTSGYSPDRIEYGVFVSSGVAGIQFTVILPNDHSLTDAQIGAMDTVLSDGLPALGAELAAAIGSATVTVTRQTVGYITEDMSPA